MGKSNIREKPLLCNAQVVRNFLEGRQTQDRRPIKPQPEYGVEPCYFSPTGWAETNERGLCSCVPVRPHYSVGDHLYVRETWAECVPNFCEWPQIVYKATDPTKEFNSEFYGWRPSIHMPKKYARIWLEVTKVRAERIQEISASGAFNEGCNYLGSDGELHHIGDHPSYSLLEFEQLWKKLYPGSWERNEWVFAYNLKMMERNP